MPGTTKASVVGFITSIVTAIAITMSRPTWAGRIGASSSALTRMREMRPAVAAAAGG